MALGTGNTIGTGVRTSNGTTTVVTTSAATTAGDVILVFVSKDNTGTTDADHNEVASVADSGGTNVYLKAGEYTNGQGSANAGVTTALFYSKTTANLASSSTITVTHDSVSDVAVSCWKLTTTGTGYSFSPVASATPGVVDGTAHGASISISSLEASIEHCFVRATAIEDEALTTDTATASYQAVTHVPSTTSGANAANTFVAGEFRIVTATSSTSNPTYTTAASTQSATIFWAFKEQANATPAPGAGSATLTGQTPTISIVEGPIQIPVGAGAATVTGQDPTKIVDHIIQPDAGATTFTGQLPIYLLDKPVPVDAGAISITTLTPSILMNHIMLPDVGTITITSQTPTMAVGGAFTPARIAIDTTIVGWA